MDLHEEYWNRKKVTVPLVKHTEKANLILRAKGNAEWAWLHVSISTETDGNHPSYYKFVVSANPVIYSTPHFEHFSQHAKIIEDRKWEWEQFEPEVVKWAEDQSASYVAVTSEDAIFVAWEMFVSNYDTWMANFLSIRIQETIFHTIRGSRSNRLAAIKDVEDYIRERFEKVHICWKNIKSSIEQKNYADWFAKIINDKQSKDISDVRNANGPEAAFKS
jgi:hypothetical protein